MKYLIDTIRYDNDSDFESQLNEMGDRYEVLQVLSDEKMGFEFKDKARILFRLKD